MFDYEQFICHAPKAMLSEISEADFKITYPDINENITDILKTAAEKRDPDELEYIIFIIYYLELHNPETVNILNHLLLEKWHYKHEDIVGILSDHRSPSSSLYLYKAVSLDLPYLTYEGDETFAFASKCIHLLGKINDADSREYLNKLTKCDNPIIAEYAEKQLKKTKVIS